MKYTKSLIIIISSPSGAGKTTVTKKILKRIKNSYLSISCTTRTPRHGEVHGKDYFFVSKKKFFNLKKQNKFIESAKVHNNFYGTLKSEVSKANNKNKIVLLDVDWQGARILRKKLEINYSIFLLPPSLSSLKKRLIKRHSDNINLALKRFSLASKDIKHWKEYDYVYINDDLTECVKKICTKITDIKNEKKYQKKLFSLIKKLKSK